MNSLKLSSGKGGARAGAGRPIGSMSRLAKEAREQAKLTGDLPHEFLLRVSRGELIEGKRYDEVTGKISTYYEMPDFEKRMDAAKSAAPYYAPKISTVEVISGVSSEQLDEIIAGAAAEAGISIGTDGESEEDETQTPSRARKRVSSVSSA